MSIGSTRSVMSPLAWVKRSTPSLPAIRSPNGMVPGLRGNDLLLETRQQQLPFGQGQPQIGDLNQIIGPGDRRDVDGLFLTVGPGFHQSHNPSHATTPKREKGRETTASTPAPPISRQSRPCHGQKIIDRPLPIVSRQLFQLLQYHQLAN
jgi:hypothetical protein